MSAVGNSSDRGDAIISEHIERARRGLWRAELLSGILGLMILLVASVLMWAIIDHFIANVGVFVRIVAWSILTVSAIAWIAYRIVPVLRQSIHPEYAAQQLERGLPELRHSLLSYLTLRPDREMSGLRGVVIRSIASNAATRLSNPAHEVQLGRSSLASLGTILLVMLVGLTAYSILSPKDTVRSVQRLVMPLANIDAPTRTTISTVDPGDVEIVEGTALEISAEILGLQDDQQAAVICTQHTGTTRVPMSRVGQSAEYRAIIDGNGEGIRHPATYRIHAGDASAGPFQIEIQSVPLVSVESVKYEPPAYTKRTPYTTHRGAIEALEGTVVTATFRTNVPVKTGKIEFNPRETGSRMQPTAGLKAMDVSEDGTTLNVQWTLTLPQPGMTQVPADSYRIVVEDHAGLQNPEPVIHPIKIEADLAPEVAIIVPERTPKNFPIGMEQLFEVHALDPDFGLRRLEFEVAKKTNGSPKGLAGGRTMLKTKSIYDSIEPLVGQNVSISTFRAEDWDLVVGDIVFVRCRAYDNRDLPGTDGPDPNSTISNEVELRIIAVEEEAEPKGEDGLRRPQEDPATAGGDDDAGGSGGSGGEGEASKQEPKSQDGNQGGQGSESDDSSSDAKDDSASSGNADSENTDNSDSEKTDSNGSDSQSSTGSQNSETPDSPPNAESDPSQTGSTPEKTADPSEADPGSPTSEDKQPGAGTESDSEAEDSPREPTSGAKNSGEPDEGTPHDGDIMERIRDHMKKSAEGTESAAEQKDPPGEQGGKPSDQGTDPDQQANPSEQGVKPSNQDPKSDTQNPESTNEAASDQQDSSSPQDGGKPDDGRTDDPSQQSSPRDDAGDDGKPSETPSNGEANQDGGSDAGRDKDSGDSTADPSNPDDSANSSDEGSQEKPADGTSADDEQQQGPSQPDPNRETTKQQGSDSDQPAEQDTEGMTGDQRENDPKTQQDAKSSGEESGQKDSQTTPESATPDAEGDRSAQGQQSGQGDEAGGNLPPEEANLEYAEQATDLVLDYLKQHQNEPDPELLEKLDWTEQDLRNFLSRWEQARDLGRKGNPQQQQEFSERLRSLGLRPRSADGVGKTAGSTDDLRGIRDSGSRVPPPALYQDAFEAFRRSLSN